MPPLVRSPAPGEQPGVKKLGRYECTEPLGGDGGFETYRGRVKSLTGLDRSFAVKVLRLKRSETASAVVEPFLQAAKRSAALSNPRIATVVDTGASEGVVFAVTPFMEGLDLAHFLAAAREASLVAVGKDDRARQWCSLVAYVGAEIARGLYAAHTQNPPLFHGALCPGNVFITSRGAVRLLDFGLRAAVRRPFEPRPRRLLPYIAPELAAPAADGTMAGDMYALGVLLCELASGDSPPLGRRASEVQILLSRLPEDLGRLLGKLVSVGPEARPSAEETASSLSACYADVSETDLVSALSSLVQHLASHPVQAQPSGEATPALNSAQEDADRAPPPPSEVDHQDAFEMAPSRSPEAMGPPPAEVADLSVSDPGVLDRDFGKPEEEASFAAESAMSELEVSPEDGFTADPSIAAPGLFEPNQATAVADQPEEPFAAESTSIGDPSLINDLLKQSRPTEPLGRSTAPRPAATHLASSSGAPVAAPPPRGPTKPGFSPTGTSVFQTPPPANAVEPPVTSPEWLVEPPPDETPAARNADLMPATPPESASIGPALVENHEVESAAAPNPVGFETPPATWGARALAALGGQAGIAPVDEPSGLNLLDQGLLDQVQAELGMPLPGSPPLSTTDSGFRRRPQSLSTDEPSMIRPGSIAATATADQEIFEAARPVPDDALLEDQLVDSPDSVSADAPWPEAHSPGYALDNGPGTSPPAPLPFQEPPSPEVAQVVASVDDSSVLSDGEALVEDPISPSPQAAFSYVDDNGEPLAESTPPAQETPHVPTMRTFAPPPIPVSKQAAPSAPPAVPTWAKSPEVQGQRPRSKLVWGLVGVALGASIVLGGLAGFLVGTRAKSMTAAPKAAPAAANPKPQAAAQEQREGIASAEPKPVPMKTKVAAPGAPAAPLGKASEPAKGNAAVVPAKVPPVPSAITAKAVPEASAKALADKGSKIVPATAWGKGVADTAGSGKLVSVSVASQPEGATVWINGKERGRTPLQVQVQSGPARVLLILAGHTMAAADITASEGAKLSKPLAAIEPPLEGEARFRAECTTQGKLPIMIDGKETGVLCPFSKLRVDPGVHKIGLFVPALGAVHEKEVTLHPGVRSIVFAD